MSSGKDGEPVDIEVSDDPSDCHPLDLSGVPVTVTLTKVNQHNFDMTMTGDPFYCCVGWWLMYC